MSNIVISFNKPVLIKESKGEVQQIDEIWGNVGLAYKWLGPLHDILNMTDPADKGLFKGFLEWYQNNQTTQVLGNALSSFEKQMNKAWESGPAGKSAALVIQGALTGVDVFTGGAGSTAVGYFARQVRDEMEEEKLEMAKKAAAEIAKAQEEASAKAKVPKLEAIINQLQAGIRQKDLEKAKQLFAAAKRLKEEVRKTDDEKGERMAAQKPSQLTRASQETMYQPTNEARYSSFKDQQMIAENFRRFIKFSPEKI